MIRSYPAKHVGRKIGQITVKAFSHYHTKPNGASVAHYLVECSCGKRLHRPLAAYINRTAVSCGCARLKRSTTHGMSKSKEFGSWDSMLQRCKPGTNRNAMTYWARGIRVTDEWQGPNGFANFYAHVGPAPTLAHTIDRIDNDKGYFPGNVRWATPLEQGNNRRTNTHIEVDGVRLTLTEAARRAGLDPELVRSRIQRSGWPPEKALSEPKRTQPRS
jgi:hypothetical protein